MRYYYDNSILGFLSESTEKIIGKIVLSSGFADEQTQKRAWEIEIELLKNSLKDFRSGFVFLEYSIPRMGSRIDAIILMDNQIFVLEFKIGAKKYLSSYYDQVFDYALDLKNFHEPSHNSPIYPIVIASEAPKNEFNWVETFLGDKVQLPIFINGAQINEAILRARNKFKTELNQEKWADGRYAPTPTIIEAARSLYNNHSIDELSRSDASAKNLSITSLRVEEIIDYSQKNNKKSICFVTGVPGAGKTLVGLNIATKHSQKEAQTSSVFLSGNGPLVAVLSEALARDRVSQAKKDGEKLIKDRAKSEVKAFIQNVHHYRDEYLEDKNAPFDHIAIFDEAQRAWNLKQTKNFMKSRKNISDFDYSEPEFLISCLDRHKDWAVIICLVGGGQEINTGEAGISEWIDSLNRSFQDWNIYVSNRLNDKEYAAGEALKMLKKHESVNFDENLHLAVSLRSFRAEKLSHFVKCLLDLDSINAKNLYSQIIEKYPLYLTRDLSKAKNWIKSMARGTERFGIVVSSQAERLKPFAIDVKSPINPIHWFLNDKSDVRSSYYMESVATEFHVQGLELDWTCVSWDGDLRYMNNSWSTWSFRGNKWQNIRKAERQSYLINAYRVLLTRARLGMIIFIPEGDDDDFTRNEDYYDGTYEYLLKCGIKELA